MTLTQSTTEESSQTHASVDEGDARRPVTVVTVLSVILGASLLQGRVLGGVNISLADAVVLCLVFALGTRLLLVPAVPFLLFTATAVLTTITALFLMEPQWGIPSNPLLAGAELAKLTASFLFFVVGVSLYRSGHFGHVLKSLAFSATALSFVGIVWTVVNLTPLRDTLFFGGFRFKGLVDDPNLCAILLLASLPYWLLVGQEPRIVRISALLVTAGGVLATGSKTGLAAVVAYLILILLRYILLNWQRGRVTALAVLCLGVLVAAFVTRTALLPPIAHALEPFPGASRALTGLASPGLALDDGGSGRSEAFSTGVQMIQHSPLTGVGPGSYGAIARELSGSDAIAHNTYLQIISEWGIPLGIAFFVIVLVLVIPATVRWFGSATRLPIAAADSCVVFLIGGLTLSLDNLRPFWLCLGVLYASRWSTGRN